MDRVSFDESRNMIGDRELDTIQEDKAFGRISVKFNPSPKFKMLKILVGKLAKQYSGRDDAYKTAEWGQIMRIAKGIADDSLKQELIEKLNKGQFDGVLELLDRC